MWGWNEIKQVSLPNSDAESSAYVHRCRIKSQRQSFRWSIESKSSYFHNNPEMEIAHVSINRRMDKLWYIHTMEYCWAIKRNRCWYMQNHGSISKALCQVNKARPRRPHTTWLHLYEILGKGAGMKEIEDDTNGNIYCTHYWHLLSFLKYEEKLNWKECFIFWRERWQ